MIAVTPMRKQDAEAITSWRYPGLYSMYDLTDADIPALLDPRNRYFGVREDSGELMGFCCFGQEGRVEGGRYEDGQRGTLDIGVGLSPEKMGRGLGGMFIKAVLLHALEEYVPVRFRVSIAEFNLRSQRAFLSQGFTEVTRFNRTADGMSFVQLEKQAKE